MQKFLRILIIICLFIICLLLGANLANISLTDNQVTPIRQSQVDENQTKILVFVVDNFEKRKPDLISIWSVIFYYQDNHGLMFVPLTYDSNENFSEFEKSFIVTSDRTINDRTIKFLNTKFRSNWKSFVVVDRTALTYLSSWISLGEILNPSTDFDSLIQNTERICGLLGTQQVAQIEEVDWSLIYPNHLNSDLTIDQMNNLWKKMSEPKSVLCEIIDVLEK